jgi:hypothetical protein
MKNLDGSIRQDRRPILCNVVADYLNSKLHVTNGFRILRGDKQLIQEMEASSESYASKLQKEADVVQVLYVFLAPIHFQC